MTPSFPLFLYAAEGASPAAPRLVPDEHNLRFTTPAVTWDEGLPLGNGIMGALVWGGAAPDNTLKISLDRADLWDLRSIPEFETADYSQAQMRHWRDNGNAEEIARLYDKPYESTGPTKIPAGRLLLSYPGAPAFEASSLDIQSGLANVNLAGGVKVRIFVHARQSVGLVRVTGTESPRIQLVAPLFHGQCEGRAASNSDYGDLPSLGYPAPIETSGSTWMAFTQQGHNGFSFAVYVAWRQVGSHWCAGWTVASSNEGTNVLLVARNRVDKVLKQSWSSEIESHRSWWTAYWEQSSLVLPNKVLEKQWYLGQYKFGAASRRGAPPLSLQGPWTADDGKLPPWKGDYHHDLNTELSYWPCYSANHLEEGLCYLDWLWDARQNNIDWTQRWWKAPGLNLPGVTDLKGNAMGGWPQYSFSATTGCWVAQHFYLHWRYSRDREFLHDRAYPYLKEIATFIEAVTAEKGVNDLRTLALSSSPETNDNRLEAWFPGITNYDLSLIRNLLGKAAELADELNLSVESAHWKSVLREMPELALAPDGALLVAEGFPLKESHRHFSWLMAIHPLGLISWNDGGPARRTIAASLADLKVHGPDWWCGFSYAWLANLQAKARDGAGAEKTLDIFCAAFTLRNSFHVNGDQSGQGYSKYTYRPFTLEGNFAAAAGIQEMLLQSNDGVVRIFPAIPQTWQDVSFHSLRAEGAFLVSAERRSGLVTRLRIVAEKGGVCTFESPFSGRELQLRLEVGQDVEFTSDPSGART